MNLFGEPDPPRAEQLTFGAILNPWAKHATPAEAEAMIARLNALPCTQEINAMTPEQLRAAIEDMEARKLREGTATPAPATPAAPAPTPEAQAAIARWRRWTARPWAATTPADKRIARQYKADETPPIF